MLKKVALVLGATFVTGLVAVLGLAATKPDTFVVQRSTTIQAPAEVVFAHIEDFHRWKDWSPYENLDPAMKRTFSGAERGKGAVYGWSGNDHAGEGRMEILETVPGRKITIKLDFLRPFEFHNTTLYTFEPKNGGTEVTWAMTGPNHFVGKVMSVFFNPDMMVGKDFESGLASLKAISEKEAAGKVSAAGQ